MPITVSCTCGKTLSVKDELAGKRGKCPACGTLLLIPQPAKAPEPEEWSLAPLDDDPKPAKPVSKPTASTTKPQANGTTTNNAAKQPTAIPAKSVTAASAPTKPVVAKLADDEFGLAPLEDDLFGKPAATAKPVNPATPAVPAKPAAVTMANKPIAGVASSAKTATSTPKPPAGGTNPGSTTVATNDAPSKNKLGGAAPAPLDLAPLDGGEEHNHAAWIDEGAETQFKVTGAPLSTATGQIFAAPPTPAPVNAPRGGREGELLCPYCNADLDSTVTAGSFITQLLLGMFAGFYLRPTTPYKCRRCGPIKYEELRGESKRTAEKGNPALMRGCLYGGLALVVLFALGLLFSMYKAGAFRDSSRPPPLPPEIQQGLKESRSTHDDFQKREEAANKRIEESQKQNKERIQKQREKSGVPTMPKFNPPPRPSNPQNSPASKPMPPPTPMPVNPFQPLD